MTRGCLTRDAVIAAFALAWLAAALPARAETPVRAARDLYDAGLQSYRAGDYDDAIAKLQASYELVPAPGLIYDIAQAQRMKHDCAHARTLYRQFLDQAPSGPVAELARARLAEMDRCVAGAAASLPDAPGAGAPPQNGPPPAPSLELKAPAQITAGSAIELPSGRVAGARDAPAAARRSRFAGRRAALVAGATTVGFAAATGYFAWRADVMSDRVSSLFVPGQRWSTAGMSDEQSGHTSETLGVVFAVATLVSGGIAAWLATRR